MRKTAIYFSYKHVAQPWGGANNFIRALFQEFQESQDFIMASDINDPYDVLFMNQLGTGSSGTAKKITLRQVKSLKARGTTSFFRSIIDRSARPKKVVVRAVNLKIHAFRMGLRNCTLGRLEDRCLLALLHLADYVVFQSMYQRRFFEKHGYRGSRDIVIHNGADLVFQREIRRPMQVGDVLRLVSSTASARETKRHDLIARFSEVRGVEVVHLGRWPSTVDPKRVVLRGVVTHSEILDSFATAHFFLHPAVKDPCPNAVCEALSAGLPTIYHTGEGSSSEIVGDNGLPLEEGDLEGTVERAREQYSTLAERVKQAKEKYSIKRAAREYAELFHRIAREG